MPWSCCPLRWKRRDHLDFAPKVSPYSSIGIVALSNPSVSIGPSAPAAHTGTSSSGPEEDLPGPKSSRAKAAALAAEAAALVNNKRNRDESEEDEETAVEEEKVVKKKPAKRVRK